VTTDEREEQASLYVLGLLEPEELRAFESEMAADGDLVALVSELETGAAGLASIVAPRTPPPAVRERIMGSIQRNEESSKIVPMFTFKDLAPWAIAACIALVAGWQGYQLFHLHLLVDSFKYRDDRNQAQLKQLQQERELLENELAQASVDGNISKQSIAALQKQVEDMQGKDALSQIRIATLESLVKNAPKAMAVVAWDETTQQGIVQTNNIPAARGDQSYQLWIIDPDYKTPVSAGIFDPTNKANFQPLHPIQKAAKFAISLEKKGGSDTPKGPIVLVGE
jgi:anti-sigma-K factor RskA